MRPVTMCYCGTFAIGRCAHCPSDVCSDHSSMVSGLRTCSSCARQRTPEGIERLNRAKYEAVQDREKRLAQIAALDDPIERLVSAVRFIVHDFYPDEPGIQRGRLFMVDIGARGKRQRDELARTCPDFCAAVPSGAFGHELDWQGAWDSQKVGAWFAKRRCRAGVEPDFTYEETAVHTSFLRGSRQVLVATHRGWTIQDGAHAYRMLILPDGRMVVVPGYTSERPRTSSHGPVESQDVLLRHLDEIARVLGLPELEICTSFALP